MAGLRRLGAKAGAWVESNPVTRFLRVLLREIEGDDVFGMAAEMAYRFLFAVFPLLLFLVTALGFAGDALGLNDLFDRLLQQASPFLPGQVVDIIDQYVSSLLVSRWPAVLGR